MFVYLVAVAVVVGGVAVVSVGLFWLDKPLEVRTKHKQLKTYSIG